MGYSVFVLESGKPFNYGAFAKYLVTCGNIIWSKEPGKYCQRQVFRKAVEVELGVDTETAKTVVETMIDLGMITVCSDNDVYINEKLR